MKIRNKLALFATLLAAVFLIGCKKDLQLQPKTFKPTNVATAADSNTLVSTPFGMLKKSNIFLVEPGSHLQIAGTHVLKIQDKTGKLLKDFGAIHSGGLSSSKVNQPPVSGNFHSLNSTIPGGSNGNWVTCAKWNNTSTSPISTFNTTWAVPSIPTPVAGVIIFIFNGLQNDTGTDIIQPVLQWGATAAGGGNYWAIANWYVWIDGSTTYAAISALDNNGGGGFAHGSPLTGIITYNGYDSMYNSYLYTSTFQGHTNSLSVYLGDHVTNGGLWVPGSDNKTFTHQAVDIPTIQQQTWAYEALEVQNNSSVNGGFGPTQSADYPSESNVKMTSIGLSLVNGSTPTPSWTPVIANAYFGEYTNVVSSSEVDLYFHPALPAISYPTPVVYTVNTPISPLSPTSTGGQPASYSISPGLSAGLTLDPATGIISGMPTAQLTGTNFTVTATNSTGSAHSTINMTVNNAIKVTSTNSTSTTFSLADGSTSITTGRTVSSSFQVTISPPSLPASTSATITMTVVSGYVPVSAFLNWGVGGNASGVISGHTITFNGVHINSPLQPITISLQ